VAITPTRPLLGQARAPLPEAALAACYVRLGPPATEKDDPFTLRVVGACRDEERLPPTHRTGPSECGQPSWRARSEAR